MNYSVRFVDDASQAIAHSPPEIKKAVKEGLRFLSENPYGGEPLTWELRGKRKLRVGRYRIIHQIDPHKKVVVILAVGHRRDIYEALHRSSSPSPC